MLTAGVITASAVTVGVTGLAGSAHATDSTWQERLAVAESNRHLARQMIDNDQDFRCFSKIVFHESSWNHHAVNPESGAYGLVQALPAQRMHVSGSDWKTNPETQIEWGLRYMDGRYGGPCEAWDFWQANHWY
jgi:hypothetical protein